MKIYGFPLSPFVRKVVVAVNEKGLAAEVVPSNPSQPDDEFAAVSPFHKIPAFRDGDFTLADSTAIVTYLEAKYPEPPLLPAAPEARAKAIWFEEVADTVLHPRRRANRAQPFPAPAHLRHRWRRGRRAGRRGGDQAAARLPRERGDRRLAGRHASPIGDIAVASMHPHAVLRRLGARRTKPVRGSSRGTNRGAGARPALAGSAMIAGRARGGLQGLLGNLQRQAPPSFNPPTAIPATQALVAWHVSIARA